MDCMGHVSQGREGGRQRWREVSGVLYQQQTWENEASRDGHHPPGAGLGFHCWALWPLKTLMHLQSDLSSLGKERLCVAYSSGFRSVLAGSQSRAEENEYNLALTFFSYVVQAPPREWYHPQQT